MESNRGQNKLNISRPYERLRNVKLINIKFIISQFLLLYTSSKNRKLFLERERANILLQDGGIETWPKKEKRIIFRDPSGSKRHYGLITIHRISQNFSSFFFPRPVSVRGTGKIKVRLSSQYCERGTNEIRAASGRISSFELARNSSRLYLLGAATTERGTQRIVADY